MSFAPLIALIASLANSWIIEMEIQAETKQCIKDIFNELEPLSVRAVLKTKVEGKFSSYITLETD